MPLPSFWSLSKPESPACPSSSGSDARSTLGPARAPSSSSASRSSPPATSRGTVSSRLLFLLGLVGALLALPLHARAQEFSSLPHLASYGIVPAAGTGSSGSGRVLSLAADASAALPPLAVLSLSFALCAPSAEGVEIFVSTSADYPAPSSADLEPADDDADGRSRWMSDSDKGVWFIDLTEGFGTWQGALRDGVRDGLWVALWGGDQGASGDVEISFSTGGFVQSVSDELPLLGDTTATHLLVRTPPFANLSAPFPVRQTYPTYTLPPPAYDPPRPASPNATVYALPTSSLNEDVARRMRRSSCWVRRTALALSPAAVVADRRVELAPSGRGWRETLVLTGEPSNEAGSGASTLAPGQNYTLFVITPPSNGGRLAEQGAGSLSGPIWARMKRADFPCPLAYALDLCPAVAHAVALPSPAASNRGGLLTSLPESLVDQFDDYLASFALSLGTWPCGRAEDRYSFVADCEDCWRAYRDWLCAVTLPRCGEAPDVDSNSTGADSEEDDMDETDAPPLLSRTPAAPRSPSLALAGVQPAYDYSELPPCLGLCYHADRLCPVFLGFRCPIATGGRDGRGTARRSYAVGSGPMGIAESREKEGVDRFGVAWCERGGEWAS